MVTGRVPFDADTPVSVALKHIQEEPVEPIVLNTDLPISINKIIMKAMKKDPNERYSSATEIIRDLNMALKSPDANFVNNTNEMPTQRINIEPKKEETNSTKKVKFAKMKEYFEKHKAQKIIAIILSAIIVFAMSMMITFAALTAGRGKDVQIPNLTNLTMEQAKTEAQKVKLKVELLEEKFDVTIPTGQIITQDPKYQDNFKVKEGSTIKVTLSKGQEMITIPKLVGKTKDEVMQILKELQIEAKYEEKNSDTIPKNNIIEQSIPENTEILAGSPIVITVSTGKEQIQVPDLSGKTEADAKSAITAAKLKYKATLKTSDTSKANGVVVNQSISAGSTVDKDTEITITINEFDAIKSVIVTVNVKSLTGYQEGIIDEEGNLIPPYNVPVELSVGGEIKQTMNVLENTTSQIFTISGTGIKEVKVTVAGYIIRTQTVDFNKATAIIFQ